MTIYQRIAAVFTAAGIPGFLQEWRATAAYPTIPAKFCTYLVTQDREALAADDAEQVHEYEVYIDLYGMTDVTQEQNTLVSRLYDAGFYIPYQRDMDNVRLTQYQYHRRLRVHYYDYGTEETT